MNLQQLIRQYLSWRETLGWQPLESGGSIATFSRFIGENVDIADVRAEQVAAFLKGTGPVTRSWHLKYGVLRDFYRWAIDRGCVDKSPLPDVMPKRPSAFVPYIYSRDELRRILQAFDDVCASRFSARAYDSKNHRPDTLWCRITATGSDQPGQDGC